MKLAFLILAISFFITACTTHQHHQAWSDELPEKKLFTDYYAQDFEHSQVLSERAYLRWIRRFYFGWELYRRGWLQATDEFVASLPEAQQAYGQALMEKAGRTIAPEWAKNKRFSVIKTRHLSIWGNSLNKAIVRGEQLQTLERIIKDAEQLIERNITPKIIIAERYFPELEFGDLDNF